MICFLRNKISSLPSTVSGGKRQKALFSSHLFEMRFYFVGGNGVCILLLFPTMTFGRAKCPLASDVDRYHFLDSATKCHDFTTFFFSLTGRDNKLKSTFLSWLTRICRDTFVAKHLSKGGFLCRVSILINHVLTLIQNDLIIGGILVQEHLLWLAAAVK